MKGRKINKAATKENFFGTIQALLFRSLNHISRSPLIGKLKLVSRCSKLDSHISKLDLKTCLSFKLFQKSACLFTLISGNFLSRVNKHTF